MKRKGLYRVISSALVITTLFGQSSGTVYASGNVDYDVTVIEDSEAIEQDYAGTDEETEADDNESLTVGEAEEPVIVSEIVDARDEFSKQFLMSDNSKSVVLYSEPVHYETEDGSFVEIDNSVEKTEEGYENVDNTFKVVFTDNEESQGEVRFEEDEYQVNWAYIDEPEIANDESGKGASLDEDSDEIVIDDAVDTDRFSFDKANTADEAANESTEEEALEVTVEKEECDYGEEETLGHVINSSTVTYDGYNNGVKLEYSPTSTGVKENIILAGKESGNTFSFKIQLSGLKARVNSANEVELYDEKTEEVKYYFPAPFMKDANDEESYDVWYGLSDKMPEFEPDRKLTDEATSEESTDSLTVDDGETAFEETEYEDIIIEDADIDTDNADTETESDIYSEDVVIEILDEETGFEQQRFSKSEASTSRWSKEEKETTDDLVIEDVSDDEATEELVMEDVSDEDAETEEEAEEEEESEGKEVEASEDGFIYLTLTADQEWLEKAEYPVSIDPIIKKVRNDLLIDSGCINTSNARNTTLYVGNEKGEVYRSYVRFELPNIEKGSIVTDAQLYLSGSIISSNKHFITAKKVTSDWAFKDGTSTKKIRTWAQKPGTDGRVIDYAVNGGYFNITRAVRDWYTNPKENYGLEFSAYDETMKKRDSINLSQTKSRPYLKVTFKHYVGLEEYWGTHSTAVGTAGMGYINDYTGALTVVNTDVSTNGARMPFNIQHVFNSVEDEENAWKLSYDQWIEVPANELDVKTYPYVYHDEDGTKHYFKAKNVTYLENGKAVTTNYTVGYPSAADEDGLKLFIVPVTDKNLKNKYPIKLIDKSSSTVKYFDKTGKLAMISDSNQYENGSNEDKKAANRITLGLEKYGEEKPTAKYQEAIDCLDVMYNYSIEKITGVAANTLFKENCTKLTALFAELVNDDYVKADYKIAKEIQTARDTIEKLLSNTYTLATIKTAVTTAKKSMTSAQKMANELNLFDERIVSVADAVNNTAKIKYDVASGKITEITDPTRSGNPNKYIYDSNGRLVKIAFANEKTASYTYDERGNITTMQDNSGYRVCYDYEFDRIIKVVEYAGNIEGQTYSITYNEDNSNSFRFSGINDEFGDNDDVVNTYVFDEKGRTFSAYSTYADENKQEVLGASACTYEDTTSKQVAKTSYDDQSAEQYINLIKNPGFENGFENWKVSDFAEGQAKIVKDEKYLGASSLKAEAGSENFALVEQEIELEKGTYTLSFRVKAGKEINKVAGIAYDNGGDIVDISYKAQGDADEWVILTGTFTIGSKRKLNIALYASDVTAYFDCIHLETGSKAHNYSTTLSTSAGSKEATDDPYIRNKIKDNTITGRQTDNLLKNHSFENNDSTWEKYVISSTNTKAASAINAYSTSTPFIGSKSLAFNMTTGKIAELGARQTVAQLDAGTYTLSAYTKVKTSGASSGYIKVVDASGKEYLSEVVAAKTIKEMADGWTRLKVTFTLSSRQDIVVAAETKCTVAKNEDLIVFDCFQLETGEIANEYNALEDGSFELTNEELPYKWSNLKNVELKDEIIGGGVDGGKCYHIQGEPGKDKYLKCKVNLGSTTSSYVLSGWFKTITTPIRKGRELRVRAYHSDENSVLESSLSLNDYSDGWKYFTLILPAHKWKDTTITIDFHDNIGDLYIDELQLSRNDVCTKTYDSSGRVTGVCTSEKTTTYGYDSYNRMNKLVTPGGVTQTFTYDAANNNTKITANFGPNSYMTYDKYGNQETLSAHVAITRDENGNATNKPLELLTQNTYSSSGNYLKSSTDNNGSVTTYAYDENAGLLLSEKQPTYNLIDLDSKSVFANAKEWVEDKLGFQKSVEFAYGYNGDQNIESVTRKNGNESRTVTYVYKDFSDLASISHNGFKYEYDYDKFGNVICTKIAGAPVSTNEYNKYNGSLKSTTYADGSKKEVTYDEYGHVAEEYIVLKNETRKNISDSYKYYNDGNIAIHKDVPANITTEYDYNEADKVCRTRVSGNVNGVDYSSRIQYTYNTQGKVEVMSYEVAEGDKKAVKNYNYTYAKDGNNVKNTLPDGSTKDFAYDTLRRNTRVIYTPVKNAEDGKKLYTTVGYKSGVASSNSYTGTQNKISNYVNKLGSAAKTTENTYEYGYDSRGNICAIDEFNSLPGKNPNAKKNDDYERIYQYNSFGEVTKARETYDNGTKIEYAYEYDAGGNIVSETITDLRKKKVIETHSYTYDSKWKDKLIKYGDDVIGYDNCGNPTQYVGGVKLTWNPKNNKLISVEKGEETYEYTYLSDGQRLTKDTEDNKTVYIYNEGMLIAEENAEYRINYYYDANGIISEIGYQEKTNGTFGKETYYFYTRNGQGDIVGIYRSSDSTLVGTYEYDLWGNSIAITENVFEKAKKTYSDTQGILQKNPLRYRGYYFDTETGFYYLNSRYYDPKVHRFISADIQIAGVSSDVTGYNLFAYCDNDPVNKIDTSGNWPQLSNKQKVAAGLAVIGVAAVLTVATAGLGGPVACFALGALQGSVMGAATGAVSGAAISGGIAFITSGGDMEKVKQAAIDGACDGFMSGAITGFITGGMTSNHCFVAGTVIATISGFIAIENIQEGDYVLSEDPETKDVTYKRVLETYINETSELIHLNIDGEELITTPAHPFYVKNDGFVLAGDLEEGAVLVDSEGNELHLLIKKWEYLQTPVPVYNFAVEDYHTYFVGQNEVFVHNVCKGGSFKDVDAGKGVDEVAHHMPQNAFDKTIDVSRNKGPALLMTKEDHALTRTFAGKGKTAMRLDEGLSARQRLVKDIMDIRSQFGTKYNEGLQELIKYAKTLPEFAK